MVAPSLTDPTLSLGIGIGLAVFLIQWAITRQNKRLPPGPFGLPFIGALFSVPQIRPWEGFFRWKQQYGSTYLAIF